MTDALLKGEGPTVHVLERTTSADNFPPRFF